MRRLLVLLSVVVAVALVASVPTTPAPGAVRSLSLALPPPLNCKPSATGLVPATSPTVRAEMEPNPGDADVNLTFCSSVSGLTGSYIVNWSFGDGRFSSTPDPTHMFSAAQNYTVAFTLNSTDYNTTLHFIAYVNGPLESSASVSPRAPAPSTVVAFTSVTANGTPPYVTYWEFGDGTNGSGSVVNHTFHRAGTFDVLMITNDSGGGSIEQTVQVTVSSPPSYLGGSTTILIGTTIAAVAVAGVGFAYFQWEKRRRPRTPSPTTPPGPPPT